jgi:molybdate transport system permease protein
MTEVAVRSPRPSLARFGVLAASILLLGFLALPFIGLLLRVSPGEVLARLARPVVIDALRLSFITSVAATAVVVVLGIPGRVAAGDA